MISASSHSSFHSSIFRRTHSPALPDRNPSVSSTQLPPIHNLLSPSSRSDNVQRSRGSTLPSYSPSQPRHASNESSFDVRTRRIASISGHVPGDTYSDRDDDDENDSRMPAAGISLPPIRAEIDASPMRTFSGLPPIKTMLPSRSHMRSIDSRSPVSPQSTQSIAMLSSSRSSNVHTSGSSGEITGRFHRESVGTEWENYFPALEYL
jgi:hypothetical protein